MRVGGLNLAERPFVNLRPIRRTALILWVLGALVMIGNVWLYWGHVTAQSDKRDRLAEIEPAIDDVADDLGDQWRNPVAAGATESDDQLAILEDDGRRHVGRDRGGWPEVTGTAGIVDVEQLEKAVVGETEAGCGHFCTE